MVDVKETMYDNSHDGVNGGGCNGGECSGGGCVTIVERKEVDLSQMLSAALASAKREFVFSNYPQRRIALLFLYFGWEHDGLVAQPDTPNTVEEVEIASFLHMRFSLFLLDQFLLFSIFLTQCLRRN